MFRIGDMAVYPSHGVGVVQAIEKKEISGKRNTFYILKILDNGMKIMIPTNNADSVGLRELIPQQMVPKVFDVLREKRVAVENQTWNRRYKEYAEKIRTGSVFEIAEVLKDLNLLKSQKTLSFGERKMLDTAKNLLIKELAIATDSEEESIKEKLDHIFNNT